MSRTTTYEVDGYLKFVEVDSFEDGCEPGTGREWTEDTRFSAPTLYGLVKKLREHVGIEDTDDIELDACDEFGRIDIQSLENSDGFLAYPSQIEAWKRGMVEQ